MGCESHGAGAMVLGRRDITAPSPEWITAEEQVQERKGVERRGGSGLEGGGVES